MHLTYQGDSKAAEAQADLFGSMADSIDECAQIVKNVRSAMEAIDKDAHEEIEKIKNSKGGWFGTWAILSMIWAILAQARSAAEAATAAAAANIACQAMRIQSVTCLCLAVKRGRRCKPPRTARMEMAMYSWRVMARRKGAARGPGLVLVLKSVSNLQNRVSRVAETRNPLTRCEHELTSPGCLKKRRPG